MGIEQGQGLGDTNVSEKLELRYVAVALEEGVAELRWMKSHRHPSTILVPSVNEETEMDLLPHNEEERGTPLPYKHTFSGGQTETLMQQTPSHPLISFLCHNSTKSILCLGVTPQSPEEGLPYPALHWGPKNHPKAAQHLELQNLLQHRGPKLQWARG